jgi:small-conductance mechanosensitive channel
MIDWKKIVIDYTGISVESIDKIISTVIILILAIVLRFFILNILFRKIKDSQHRYKWRKNSSAVLVILVILIIGRIWLTGFESIITFLGLLSAGLAFALKDPIANIAARFFIMWRRPFHVGDRIQIGDLTGDIIDIRLFQFSVLEVGNWVDADQSTGRIVHVPNAQVFVQNQANYTQGFHYIWNEISICITFESNWQKAQEVLMKLAEEKASDLSPEAEKQFRAAATQFLLLYGSLKPNVYISVKDFGVQLSIRYLCPPRQRRASEQVLWKDILNLISANDDIELAYPTTRFYNRFNEK